MQDITIYAVLRIHGLRGILKIYCTIYPLIRKTECTTFPRMKSNYIFMKGNLISLRK